jgi:hypothetical protein
VKSAKQERKRFGTVLAYVRWFDSAIYREGTCHAEDLTGFMENESSGLLISEDDSSVTIALDRCLETQGLRLVLCIPRANIRSFRAIRV